MNHPRAARPDWWGWELELSPHVLKRMVDRRFTETDLRLMIDSVVELRPDVEAGRWIVDTLLDDRRWHVVIEPDSETRRLVVVTAYKVDSR